MNRSFARAAFAVVVAAAALPARAQLLYSFEDGTQGFGPNGFPVPTVAQDTTGATQGTHSLLFGLGQTQTFSGALTQTVNPAVLLSPNTSAIAVDVTIPQGDGEYTGAGFANMGITYFGANPSQGQFGVQVQTNGPSERNVDLAPGTYTLTIPLISTAGTPFRNAFGTGAGQLTDVTGLQFYINKSADDAMTVYLDNVRAVPEPTTAALACAAGLGLVATSRRRAMWSSAFI
jgi:hypothetical protein